MVRSPSGLPPIIMVGLPSYPSINTAKRMNGIKGLTTYYARHTWAYIAFNLGIQKDVVSLALGHSFGVRVTDTYINADLSRVDEANRRVIDYVIYNKK